MTAVVPTLRLSDLNKSSVTEFTRALSSVYEHSPWAAEGAAQQRPFDSLPALAKAMARVVAEAGATKQMELIRAHPSLTGKLAGLTESSKQEQSKSMLDKLPPAAKKQFHRYLSQYEERHGFPFITCVLALDSDAIVRQAGERVYANTDAEMRRALKEIERIAWMRLQRTVVDDSPHATPSTISVTPPAPLGASRSSVGTKIVDCQYGKSRVRVLKVLRSTPIHSVIEVDVQVLLRGALNSTFTRGDNSLVVPTDTCKNTVLVLSRQSLNESVEEFAMRIGAHFLAQYAHLSSVDVKCTEKLWERMVVATESTTEPGIWNGPAAPHQHAFQQRGPERMQVHAVSTRTGVWVSSGVSDFTVMKSTASGFEHFPRDDGLTTLPPTADRIFATKIAATWQWAAVPAGGFRAANARLMEWMLVRFTSRYSVSVQATEYEMALDALAAIPEIRSITITLPNVHFLPFNLQPFNLPFEGTVFIPTDEPHGTIEIAVEREGMERAAAAAGTKEDDIVMGPFKGTKATAPLPPRPRL